MNKISTGIAGLDKILYGGYPKERAIILKGGPGCGKTVFCLFFAHKNILNDRHVSYLTCDEAPETMLNNMDQYGLSGTEAHKKKKLSILDFRPNLYDIVSGRFELDALFLRIKSSLVGEDPVLIIDSLQNLMIGLETPNYKIDLLNIFAWCKEHRITLLVTAASGFVKEEDYYFEEYAADCVISLEQHIRNHLMTRYVRVTKMRGSGHGTNQYPFLLTNTGVSILPVTDTRLEKSKGTSYISTGISKLDQMLGGQGYFESSAMMISGTSGTAKSILAATFAISAAKQKRKVLYISFEESPSLFSSNVKSAGVHFDDPRVRNMITIVSFRSIEMGLEEHLINIILHVVKTEPSLLIIDPITSLLDVGTTVEIKSLLIRLISYAKSKNITFIFSQFLHEYGGPQDFIAASSLVDTWIKLALVESDGEFNGSIHVVKSRGSATSNQLKEFYLSDNGMMIEDPYIGEGGMIFGAKKLEKESIDQRKKELLINQLSAINTQIDLLNQEDKAYEQSKRMFDLFEKKQIIEMKLQMKETINLTNTKSRNHHG